MYQLEPQLICPSDLFPYFTSPVVVFLGPCQSLCLVTCSGQRYPSGVVVSASHCEIVLDGMATLTLLVSSIKLAGDLLHCGRSMHSYPGNSGFAQIHVLMVH